jgi:hypothetical protein
MSRCLVIAALDVGRGNLGANSRVRAPRALLGRYQLLRDAQTPRSNFDVVYGGVPLTVSTILAARSSTSEQWS